MPAMSLGDILRSLREEKNLSREQLYSQTKILVKYIEALEDGRWDLLPGQVYLKPFVKNIADALGADYEELCAIIDKTDKKTTAKPAIELSQEAKSGFDYRWLAVALLVILAGLIIFLLRPRKETSPEPSTGPAAQVIVPEENHAIFDRQYTSRMDMPVEIAGNDTIHTLEITAIDTVWLELMGGDDTLYFGFLRPGRKLIRESAKPLKLSMGRANAVEIFYDDIELENEKYLLNKRRIDFSQIEPVETTNTGE
jgi:cytoskeleton protein RodZ